MKIPWVWMIFFTMFEILFAIYKNKKGQNIDFMGGTIFGVWIVGLISYLFYLIEINPNFKWFQ